MMTSPETLSGGGLAPEPDDLESRSIGEEHHPGDGGPAKAALDAALERIAAALA